MEINSRLRPILALSDGRAGNVAMALGLAEAVARITSMEALRKDVPPSRIVRNLPPAIWSRVPGRLLARAVPADGRTALLIGAGRRVAPYIAAARRSFGLPVVQILDSGIAPGAFDYVVTPGHDRLAGKNVLNTLGSVHRVTPEGLALARERWQRLFHALPSPRVAVLIGGATRRTPLRPRNVAALGFDLASLAATGASLMITASRRTGEANAARLRAAVPDAWFWDGRGENPYFGMLAWADALIVTDDSVNMASEAAATGKPLAIYPLLDEGGKLARFHAALMAAGHAESFRNRLPVTAGKPLLEADRIARYLAARLDLERRSRA